MEELEIFSQTLAGGGDGSLPQAGDYIFVGGKRYVRPYYFEFICHVKDRWSGKTVVDLFADEFRGRPYDYYVGAVKSGRIKVDGQIVQMSHTVKTSQKMTHFLHRHEPPVLVENVVVLLEEPDVVTVCKPASAPVHPCGQYRKNTVIGILHAEHGLAPLFPIHRLDRLVSGLLIFARNAEKAEFFRQQIEAGLVQKEYVARVKGIFPDGEQVVDAHVNYNAREGRSTVEVDNQSNGRPLKGKVACTKFITIRTDGIHSIVSCKPITGRTHQIRVHLQYLGHPIANDSLYLSDNIASPRSAGREGDVSVSSLTPSEESFSSRRPDVDACANTDLRSAVDGFTIDPMCTNCPDLGPSGYDFDEEGLWLHCLRYSGPGWSYECPLPDWALIK